jgi:iron-sulfur cluster assembly protein
MGGCCGGGHGGHGHGGHGEDMSGGCGSGMGAAPMMTAVTTAVGASVSITPKAAEKLLQLIQAEGKNPAEVGLRLAVQGGGCSGMQYFMDFDGQRDDDRVFEQGGVRVIVDPRSIMALNGAILDYSDGLMGSGFQIKNPNVKGSCGCGQSFTT